MKNSINYCSGILSLVLVTTMLVVALTVLVSRRILACSGHEVRIFIDGHQLLEQFHGADVIVSDVNMPGAITGMELAARVRAAGYHGGMIADTSDSSTHELCIASGFVAVMANPTPAPFHIVTIESVHNRRELRLGVGQQADDVDTANSPNLTRYTETQGGDINRTVQ